MTFALMCLGVFVAAVTIDYSHARCVTALVEGRRYAAATWSVCQWMGATVGFIVAIKMSMWVLPFECAGLFLGTLLGSRNGSTLPEG